MPQVYGAHRPFVLRKLSSELPGFCNPGAAILEISQQVLFTYVEPQGNVVPFLASVLDMQAKTACQTKQTKN